MVRKVSDDEAKAMQDQQARAALRRLDRQMQAASRGEYWEHQTYIKFLVGCRDDVARSIQPPVPRSEGRVA